VAIGRKSLGIVKPAVPKASKQAERQPDAGRPTCDGRIENKLLAVGVDGKHGTIERIGGLDLGQISESAPLSLSSLHLDHERAVEHVQQIAKTDVFGTNIGIPNGQVNAGVGRPDVGRYEQPKAVLCCARAVELSKHRPAMPATDRMNLCRETDNAIHLTLGMVSRSMNRQPAIGVFYSNSSGRDI
jgi:hypothetical protein